MSAAKIIGYFLIASPFAALTVFMVIQGGWRAAVAVWGTIAVILVVFAAGSYLINLP